MGNPQSYLATLGIGLENAAGTPVDSQYRLDFISEALKGQGEPIRRRCINGRRAAKGAVMGGYSAEGDVNVEATPDKISKLLYAALTDLTSSGSGDPYTHVFKPGDTLLPVTVQIRRGDQYFVYPGLYIARLTFRGVIDAILEMTFGFQGRAKEKIYNAAQNDGGITESDEDPFVFHQATTSLHGSASTDTNNWEVSLNTGLTRHKGLGAGRAHNRAHPGDALTEGSFDVVFDTVEEHRRWMGAASSAYPIAVGDEVQTFAARLKYQNAAGDRALTLDLPRSYYKASSPAVAGREGLIMQRCEFSTLWDTAEDCDCKITLKNGEDNATIILLGTNV